MEGQPITAEELHAARIFLGKTQGVIAVEFGGANISTWNRWENGHSVPKGARRILLEQYLTNEIGKDWRTKALKDLRYGAYMKLQRLAEKRGRYVPIPPGASQGTIEEAHRVLLNRR